MKIRKQSIQEMQQILHHMESLQPDAAATPLLLDEYLKKALNLCHKLLQQGYTEENSGSIVNYCKMKLEFAHKQIENGDLEEGLQFAKTVLTFYLREAQAEDTAPTLENTETPSAS